MSPNSQQNYQRETPKKSQRINPNEEYQTRIPINQLEMTPQNQYYQRGLLNNNKQRMTPQQQ